MTKRERIIAALNRERTDRLPFVPLVDGYFVSSLPEQGLNMELIECLRMVGCDIIERHVPAVTLHYRNHSYRREENGKATRHIHETPVGTIFQENLLTGKTSMITKHLVESSEDMKVFTYMAENACFTADFEKFYRRHEFIGDDGIATPSGPMSPVQEALQIIAGVENTVYLMNDYPQGTEALFNAMNERNLRHYKMLAELDCPLVFDYEDTSSTVMSKEMFVKYSVPPINEYAGIINSSGKKFVAHMCGKLSLFADEIGECRVDGIDCLCPPGTGDFECFDARAKWGNKMVIIGGIDPPSLNVMTVDETLQTVAGIIRKMPDSKGFILATGGAVPYGTPIDNLRAVVRLIELLGEKSLLRDADEGVVEQAAGEFRKLS